MFKLLLALGNFALSLATLCFLLMKFPEIGEEITKKANSKINQQNAGLASPNPSTARVPDAENNSSSATADLPGDSAASQQQVNSPEKPLSDSASPPVEKDSSHPANKGNPELNSTSGGDNPAATSIDSTSN